MEKAYLRLWEAWTEVQFAGNRDPEVVSAMKDVITCLEDLGYQDVKPDLLFTWHSFVSPKDRNERESKLTQEERDLRSALTEPS